MTLDTAVHLRQARVFAVRASVDGGARLPIRWRRHVYAAMSRDMEREKGREDGKKEARKEEKGDGREGSKQGRGNFNERRHEKREV